MIVSHKHKWVFVHNPKAAGTSVREALSEYHDDEREFWHQGWLPTESRVIDLAHLTADIWPKVVDRRYVAFGFVRNPYTRFLSGLTEVMRRHKDDFRDDLKTFIMDMLTPANLRFDWRFIHLCPQHYFFFNANKLQVDHIGRVESIGTDWAGITALLDIRMALPRSRVGVYSETSSNILDDVDILTRVNSLYLMDFRLFGYKMNGTIESASHSERISIIHDPSRFTFFSEEEINKIGFTDGEKVALNKRMRT